MAIKKQYLLLLFLIILGAVFLRFYKIDQADVINDEVIIAFRSIGYIDFFSSPYQTTPWEWFSDIPAWARLSFHDHPPLVFLIQHFFFKIFGQNIIALRLPFALAGIASVFLLYLIGNRLFNRQTGIIASLLLAVSNYHIWISRTGLQESMVIFFFLLTFYFFIKALNTNKHWQWGIALGLAMITKYTTFILIPIFIIYFLLFQRSVFKDKRFWLAVIIIVLIFSPVIIYNFKLYQARGHFDLQFSYLAGQYVTEWDYLPGKIKAGSFYDRLRNLIPALQKGILWPMFILFGLSLLLVAYRFFKEIFRLVKSFEKDLTHSGLAIFLLILAIFFHISLFLLIGTSKRFVVMVVPLIILLIAWFIYQQQKIVKYLLIIILIVLEIFFSLNTLITYYPIGKENLTYSYLWVENYNWGYNQLNTYLVQLLKDKKPAMTFTSRYQFLEDIKIKALQKAEKENKSPAAILLIYDSDMYDLATFWLFHRRLVYQGWPIVTSDDYLEKGKDFWQNQEINDFYFFRILDRTMLLQPPAEQSSAAADLASQLETLEPEIIKRPDGREVFAVYHWQ